MSNPSNTLLEVEETLHSVIDSLIDSQKEFQKIGEELNDPTLKLYFLDESLQRAEFGAIWKRFCIRTGYTTSRRAAA